MNSDFIFQKQKCLHFSTAGLVDNLFCYKSYIFFLIFSFLQEKWNDVHTSQVKVTTTSTSSAATSDDGFEQQQLQQRIHDLDRWLDQMEVKHRNANDDLSWQVSDMSLICLSTVAMVICSRSSTLSASRSISF